MSNTETDRRPFFARLLEKDPANKVQTGVQAGATTKYPSDSDEEWPWP